MKKNLILVIFLQIALFFSTLFVNAQNPKNKAYPKARKGNTEKKGVTNSKPLVAYLKDGKWYFLDTSGKLLFEPLELLDVLGYSEGFSE